MDSSSPYESSIAKRTRRKLEDFYRNWHNDVKKKRAGESDGSNVNSYSLNLEDDEMYTENRSTNRRERSHDSEMTWKKADTMGSTWRIKRGLYEEEDFVDSEDSLDSDSSDDDDSDEDYAASREEDESDVSEYSNEEIHCCGGGGGGGGSPPIETKVVDQQENEENNQPILVSSGEEEELSHFLSATDSDSSKSPNVNNVVEQEEKQKLVDSSSSSSYSNSSSSNDFDSLSFAHNSNVSPFSISRNHGLCSSKKNAMKEKSPLLGKLSRSGKGKRSNSSMDVGLSESSKKRQKTSTNANSMDVEPEEKIPINEITTNVDSVDEEPDEQTPFNQKSTKIDSMDDVPDKQRPFNVKTTNVDSVDEGPDEEWEINEKTTNVDSMDEESDEQRPMSNVDSVDGEPDDRRSINENIESSFDKEVDEETHTIVNESTGPARERDSTKLLSDHSTRKETDEDTPAIVDSAKASLFEKTSKARELDSTKILSDLTQKEADKDNPIKRKKKTAQEAIKMLFDFLDKERDGADAPVDNNLTLLPLKFRFEDEEILPPPEKTDWEKEIDSFFSDLNMGLMKSEADCSQPTMVHDDLGDTPAGPQVIDDTPVARCGRGEHDAILDEQIGLKCQYCGVVLLEIEHILPEFYTPPPSQRNNKKNLGISDSNIFDEMKFNDSDCANPTLSSNPSMDAVESLIPGGMYPHQREGFKFMWKHIAIDGNGCIISHAPGTGKTRLSIVFLQAYMNKYPNCRPVIIAPRGMLLTWEDEFRKWGFNIPFYNLNKLELAEDTAIYVRLHGQLGPHWKSRNCIRLIKVFSWLKSSSILGVSYPLFEKLAGERSRKGQHEKIKEWLLNTPGLLVLDEGHTPRSDQSLTWKALSNVTTNRRIMLSGTPFQNNFEELYNTLCLVNPMFADRIDKRGQKMIYKACKIRRSATSDDQLMKLRAIIEPFVHVHKGTILQQSLPGLRDSLVILRPTELQKSLLEIASKTKSFFQEVLLVSLISVHPCLVAEQEMFSSYKSEVDKIGTSIEPGVKTKFVTKLARLADALGERVLVFSQFIDPLVYIKEQLESLFSWKEGKEVIYMDGKLDVNQRQHSIRCFNHESSEAKVLLASQRACSEGINLVGASRVVLLDVAWNPSVERQAISRAYRLGQKKVVHVYRLVTSGTVEVQKYESQAHKDRISQLMFSPSDGPTCREETSKIVAEDKVFEALVDDRSLSDIFEKIIHQPKSSELIDTFDFTDLKSSVGHRK